MPRLALAALAPLALAVGAAADPPKEPAHDGKTVSEWVRQLGADDADARRKAAGAVRALAGRSDEVVGALVAATADADAVRGSHLQALVDLGPRAVPALTAGLWTGDERARRLRLLAVSRIGADARAAAPTLAQLLTHPVVPTRAWAAIALGDVGGHAAVPALTKALSDDSAGVRLAAAGALVHLGAWANDVLPALTAALKKGGADDRKEAAGVLARLGPEAAPAVPDLAALLSDAGDEEAVRLAAVLGRVGPPAAAAAPALKRRAADGKAGAALRAEAAVALWRVARDPEAARVLRGLLAGKDATPGAWRSVGGVLVRIDPGPDTVAALEHGLKSEDPEVAAEAARLLGPRSKDAVPRLAGLLAHKDARVRAVAVVALAELGPAAAGAADALRAATKDDEPLTAFWAAVAVCRLDPTPDAVAAVAAHLADRDPVRRLDAAAALGPLGAAAKPAAGKLAPLLADPDPRARLAAAVAAWKVGAAAPALPAAAGLLKDPDPAVRKLAAMDLGAEFGPDAKAAVPDLVRCLYDPFAEVRSAAAEALGRVGPGAADAVGPLLTLLDGDEPGFVVSAACEAVGLIGPDRAVAAPVLERRLAHPDPLVRTHAELALLAAGVLPNKDRLADRLEHRDYRVRITAAEALWRAGKDERAVPLLVRALEEANLDGTWGENERYMAARALGRVGPAGKPAAPELAKLLAHPDAQLAATAAAALKAIDPDAAEKAGVK